MHNAKNTRLLPSRRWTAKEDFGQSLSAATDQSVSTGQGPAILRSISFMIRWTDRFLKSRVSYRTVSVSFVRIHAKTRRGMDVEAGKGNENQTDNDDKRR